MFSFSLNRCSASISAGPSHVECLPEIERYPKISISALRWNNGFNFSTYTTNFGGFCKLMYLTMSWSGSMLAQAYRSDEKFGPKMTIDRPTALWTPSSGKFWSENTTRLFPMSERDKNYNTKTTTKNIKIKSHTNCSNSSWYITHITSKWIISPTFGAIKIHLKQTTFMSFIPSFTRCIKHPQSMKFHWALQLKDISVAKVILRSAFLRNNIHIGRYIPVMLNDIKM